MTDITLHFTPEAQKTILNMQHRVNDIAMMYGENSKEYVEAARSLLHCLIGMIQMGGCVFQDSELSLYLSSFMEVGIIFHAKRLENGERDPLLGEWTAHS